MQWKTAETRYTDREWNDEEVAAFENGIAQHGAELRFVKDEIGTRTMAEVVRFYGKWKKLVIILLVVAFIDRFCSARLREEHTRSRGLNGATKLEDEQEPPSPPVVSDDEDRKSTRLNSSHSGESRMPSSA